MKTHPNYLHLLLPILAGMLACVIGHGGRSVSAQQVPGTDPATKITVECRLLEMPPAQADEIMTTMIRWSENPAVQGRQMLKLLWGDTVKKSLEIETETLPFKRAMAKKSAGPPAPWVPVGADPAKWRQDMVTPGESLSLEAYLLPQRMANLVELVLAYHSTRLNGTLLTQASCQNRFHGFNGIPMIFGRYDSGGVARLIVGRASWFDPGASEQLIGRPIAQLYVRSQVLAVPKHLEAEAARRLTDPSTFVPWLKSQCPSPFMLGIVSASSGQSLSVEFVTEEKVPVKKGYLDRHLVSGLRQQYKPVLGTDKQTLEINAQVECRLPKAEAGQAWSTLADRRFELARGTHLRVRLGESAVARMSEWLPSDAVRAEAELVETPDVFIIVEPVWPGKK